MTFNYFVEESIFFKKDLFVNEIIICGQTNSFTLFQMSSDLCRQDGCSDKMSHLTNKMNLKKKKSSTQKKKFDSYY